MNGEVLPRIFAVGGAFLSDPSAPTLHRFVASLTDSSQPRVCFLPTATGDHPEAIAAFYRVASSNGWRPNDLPLFQRTAKDVRSHLLGQDSSGSPAATRPTRSRSGASTASTGSFARRGSRG